MNQQEVSTELSAQSSLISDIMGAGLAVQSLLLLLIVMSVISWAIILKKRKVYKQMMADNGQFLDLFWAATSLDQVKDKLERHEDSSLSRIFSSGYSEIERIKRRFGALDESLINNVERSLRKGQEQELAKLEDRLSFLATTGSTAPFIGLLGTVLGIMNSFRAISNAGSASLATVAPGISEALFATAVGLFAAIPAVMAYNHLLNEVGKHQNQMNDFISEFLNISRIQNGK